MSQRSLVGGSDSQVGPRAVVFGGWRPCWFLFMLRGYPRLKSCRDAVRLTKR